VALVLPVLKARQAKPALIIGGVDILLGLASQTILQFTYTDNTSDQADDISVSIADPTRSWMQRYLPQKGMECQASISISDWNAPFDNRTLRCGTFFVDNVSFRWPPNVVSVRAVSIPTNTGLKNEKRTKSWENMDLQSIAGEVAGKNNLTAVYDTKINPMVKRTDQVEKADIQYIRERAKESSLSVKIHDKKLIIYSEAEYEAKSAVFTLRYGADNILEGEFNSKSDDTYSSAENAYVNPETGKLTEAKFTPGNPPEGVNSALKLNEKAEIRPDGAADMSYNQRMMRRPRVKAENWDYMNDAAAQNAGKGEGVKEESLKKCQSKLREKNKKEYTGSIKTAGNLNYLSGINFQLIGFGIFDGKWACDSAVHDLGEGGYTTQLKLHKTLEGY
jgi:hypothetical protein